MCETPKTQCNMLGLQSYLQHHPKLPSRESLCPAFLKINYMQTFQINHTFSNVDTLSQAFLSAVHSHFGVSQPPSPLSFLDLPLSAKLDFKPSFFNLQNSLRKTDQMPKFVLQQPDVLILQSWNSRVSHLTKP